MNMINSQPCLEFTDVVRHKVYDADCLELLMYIPDQSVDLIIADPPYYHMKGEFDFAFHSEQEYVNWCVSWVAECYRVLKPTGAFYCWCSGLMLDKISVYVLDRFDWIRRNLIVWNYSTGRPEKAAYRYETEFLWFYSNPQHLLNHDAVRIPYHPGAEKDRRKNPKGKTCGNVWEFPRIMSNYRESTGHPTQKPEKLAERMILASSQPGDLVLVPFAGSGSELVPCVQNGRDFLAAEINSTYVQQMLLPRLERAIERRRNSL